jgi:hypothetical protein
MVRARPSPFSPPILPIAGNGPGPIDLARRKLQESAHRMSLSRIVHRATRVPLLRLLRPMFSRMQARRLRRLVEEYHAHSSDPEVREVVAYLRQRPTLKLPLNARPPYDFVDAITPESVQVEQDDSSGYPYVLVQRNRIYFPKELSWDFIRESVAIARWEQHAGSPHEYLPEGFQIDQGDRAVLAGASDGIFALSIVERVSKVYLFEPEPKWHRPLELTTRQWAGRVEIVPKYLGGVDERDTVTLDHFMMGKGELNYLQADVEGAEESLLRGAARTIRETSRLRMSICCYHNHDDARRIADLMRTYGLQVGYSRGYFVMGLREPYLRRGVAYGCKGCSLPDAAATRA